MFENKKIIIVTPAGRKRYLEILIKYILNLRDVVDEYRLWVNTKNEEDILFIEQLAKIYPEFIKLEYNSCLINQDNPGESIYSFFKNCKEPNTVYIRFDDDIIRMEGLNEFKNFLKFRIDHPEYFLVYGNILNNAITTHIHQRKGNLNISSEIVSYDSNDIHGWNNAFFAENLHRQVLDKKLNDFHFGIWKLYNYERVSINCISWLGEEFEKFNGIVHPNEEQWLSVNKPMNLEKFNVIYGDFVCLHYAFFTQRGYLDTTDILDKNKLI